MSSPLRLKIFPLSLVLMILGPLQADGPADNAPDTVRPIPPPGMDVPDELRVPLERLLHTVQREIEALEASVAPELLADVRIFEKAVRYALVHREFFRLQDIEDAKGQLETALFRCSELREGRAPWATETGLVVRGFVSRIDGSVQPYGLVIPESVREAPQRARRLDLWFHGRGEKLSEVAFLADRSRNPGVFTPADTIVLHPYGRYSNAFKFAGEIDVLEALDSVRSRYAIDEDRIADRGFSMGGAAAWQFAVHHPDLFFAANPGAGFSETPEFLRVFQGETLTPTAHEKRLWHLYDCTDWALNLYHCPTVAYSGEIDRQKQAADIMAAALEKEGIDLVHVIGPGTGHKYHPEAHEEVERRLAALAREGRERNPSRLRFVTYTLRYDRVHWLRVVALGEHWSRAEVRADRVPLESLSAAPSGCGPVALRVSTRNVGALRIEHPPGESRFDIASSVAIEIDGVTLVAPRPRSDRSYAASLVRSGDSWTLGELDPSFDSKTGTRRKRHGLQGPIDDAFLDRFIFVRPTGTSRNPAIAAWARAELARAVREWRRHFRGDAIVVDDTELSDEMIQSANVVLWGEPASNRVLARLQGDLPIQWTDTALRVGEASWSAADHVPALIFPNPLAPDRYVVLNSGFTFREYDYLNNARQVPKLPDWAVIDVRTPPGPRYPGRIVDAGFFDEDWKLPEKKTASRGARGSLPELVASLASRPFASRASSSNVVAP